MATYPELLAEKERLIININNNKLMLIILMAFHQNLKTGFNPQVDKNINLLSNQKEKLNLEEKTNFYLTILKKDELLNSFVLDIEQALLKAEGKLFFDWCIKNSNLKNKINLLLKELSIKPLGSLNEYYFRNNLHYKSKLSSIQNALLTQQKKLKHY